MRFKIITLIAFIFIVGNAFSQRQILVGFELGPTWGYPRNFDPAGGNLNNIGGSWGANLAVKIQKNFFIESGIYKYSYGYSSVVQLANQSIYIGGLIKGLALPIRLHYKFGLLKNKLSICPSLGVLFLNNQSSPLYIRGIIIDSSGLINDTVRYTKSYHKLIKTIPLAEIGLNIEYKLSSSIIIDFSFYYAAGLSKASASFLSYNINNGLEVEHPVSTNSKGNHLQIFLE